MDNQKHSIATIKSIYNDRWNVEELFKIVKSPPIFCLSKNRQHSLAKNSQHLLWKLKHEVSARLNAFSFEQKMWQLFLKCKIYTKH